MERPAGQAGALGVRLAGRLTAELILRSPQYMSVVKDYELDLRGNTLFKEHTVLTPVAAPPPPPRPPGGGGSAPLPAATWSSACGKRASSQTQRCRAAAQATSCPPLKTWVSQRCAPLNSNIVCAVVAKSPLS